MGLKVVEVFGQWHCFTILVRVAEADSL